MDAYLVPASSTRYALYCEEAPPPVDEGDDAPRSWTSRLKATFRKAVDEGEEAERGGSGDVPERSRLRRLITRKIAETVAEQRLLWRLRDVSDARLLHPDTLAGADAVAIARSEFEADYVRHRRWLVIDALLVAITGPLLFFVPGPNVVSWYFTFRAIGHFFSMRGARRALSVVTWTPEPSTHLSDVARALALEPETRTEVLERAAAGLGLERLVSFVARVADRSPDAAGVYSRPQ